MLLEGVFGGHDNIPADWAEMTSCFQQPVNFDNVCVVAAQLIEELGASFDLTLDFLDYAHVGLEGFLAGEFLKRKFLDYFI